MEMKEFYMIKSCNTGHPLQILLPRSMIFLIKNEVQMASTDNKLQAILQHQVLYLILP